MRLTDQEIDDIKQTAPVYVSAKAVNAIAPMVEAKLTAKREWVGLTYNEIIDTSNEFQVLDKGDSEPWFDLVGYASAIEDKLKEKNT